MIAWLSLLGTVIFAALAAIHVAWGFGIRGTTAAVVPTRSDGTAVLSPGPLASLTVAGLLSAAAYLLAERGGWGPGLLPVFWRAAGTAGLSLVMLLRGIGDFRYVGIFKRERDSRFARMDTRYYTPLVLLLALLAGLVAALGR